MDGDPAGIVYLPNQDHIQTLYRMSTFLLYGANGYTGRLIARYAADHGLTPILAGRNREALEALANTLGMPFRVADLEDAQSIDQALTEVDVVLHAAGPFRHTARKMMEACLRTHTHYLDITGEIAVFELAKSMDEKAREAGIMIMSGVGFDVVPTDCIALYLKNRLPDATHLKLAFGSVGGGLSHGTAITMAEGAGEPGAARVNGNIVPVPIGQKGMWVDFGLKRLFTMTIPWGDVSTAFTTTGIPNIETYTAVSPKTHSMLKYQWLFNWFLRLPFVKARAIRKIKARPAGPDDGRREKSKCLVWGEVKNAAGAHKTARLTGPEGYTLTAITSLIITRKVLEGSFKAGYQTPAGCYGEDLIMEVPNVQRDDI
jgi:short subunit dehydrogenase-like uncharacterized protein